VIEDAIDGRPACFQFPGQFGDGFVLGGQKPFGGGGATSSKMFSSLRKLSKSPPQCLFCFVFMLRLSGSRQFDGFAWCLLGFLLESVEEDHFPAMLKKENAGDRMWQCGPRFPEPGTKGINQRLSPHGTPLNRLDVFTNAFSHSRTGSLPVSVAKKTTARGSNLMPQMMYQY